MVSPLCALEVQKQNSLDFSNSCSFLGQKNLNGKREKLTPPADLLRSHHQICAGLHRRADGQQQALIVAPQQKPLPPRVPQGPLQRQERSHPSAAVLRPKQTETEKQLYSRFSSVVQSLIRSSHWAQGLLGGVIRALNFGLQATAGERRLLAKTNKRQAPESFLPAPARRQEGKAPGQHGAHPAALPPGPLGEAEQCTSLRTAGVLVCSVFTHHLSNAFNAVSGGWRLLKILSTFQADTR